MAFKQATKTQAFVTISLEGVSGAGKTYSAAEIAKNLCPPGKRVYHICSEQGSASKYADVFDFLVDDDFGEKGKLNYHPDAWIKKMQAAAAAGDCGVLILDTATHMWKGEGGVLSVIDTIKKNAEARGKKADGFNAWQDGDKLYRRFMDTLLSLPFHRIFTLRSKMKHEKQTNEKGYVEVKKTGYEPEYRDQYEFEVDIQLVINQDHVGVPAKHRLGARLDGQVFQKPGKDFAEIVQEWVSTGAPLPKAVVAIEPPPATTPEPPMAESTASPEPVTEQSSVSLKDSILSQIAAATTKEELSIVSKRANGAKNEGLVVGDDWKAVLAAFSARQKAVAGVAA